MVTSSPQRLAEWHGQITLGQSDVLPHLIRHRNVKAPEPVSSRRGDYGPVVHYEF